ncbi:AAA family ATPase [Moraxella nasovis]|uniref:ATP-binding protein n=1 Tax=Moraxella nasovis TaxID=2904121 RepID=UPI001F60BF93|nr:ATP-binding protein [Moraxella nasovis]UNU73464.1 AAA family ATPase [Moraxella nasovis]
MTKPDNVIDQSSFYQTLKDKHRLTPQDAKSYTNPDNLTKASTFDSTFGQARAVKAINTALDIKARGYHVFAVGENGLGKRAMVTNLLKNRANNEPTPPDLVYVHCFDNPRKPVALTLPSGQGNTFAKDVHKLWHTFYKKLLVKFGSIGYQNTLQAIKADGQAQEQLLIDTLNNAAKPHNLTLLPNDLALHQSAKLTVIDDSITVSKSAQTRLQKQLNKTLIALDDLEEQINGRIDELHKTIVQKLCEPLFSPLFEKYTDKPIATYLRNYQNDIIQNVLFIVDNDENFLNKTVNNIPYRYFVNVLVSHSDHQHAPIIYEDMPTYANLLGHIEYTTELGTVMTDASMIRAGALHRANGGYLLLEASSLLEHPYAWQGLKSALQSQKIRMASLEQMLTMTGSVSLEPEEVALDIKVILLGEPDLYYELLEFEPEFNALFKIRADFAETTERNLTSQAALIGKMTDMIAKQKLPKFDDLAFAVILDELSVLADDKHKFDLHSDRLMQLLVESSRHALLDGSAFVKSQHVKSTLADMTERKGYLQELYWQEIKTGSQIIKTNGKQVGQINALTVVAYADSEFGMPARLTALIAPKFGSGEILDIERDVELGGSLHAKGMLIMTSYLRSLFSEFVELNFSASLAFEQSYAHIDGDSATLAEACALLSALADVPIFQNLAITGSMNQLGEAQAVGGVNAKIAGFFDACVEQGLDGTQGVILPQTNVTNLMLRDDIVDAVADGKFHLYAVNHINEALSLLTGIDINTKTKKGLYKKKSLFGKILNRLYEWEDKEDEKADNSKDQNKEPKNDIKDIKNDTQVEKSS